MMAFGDYPKGHFLFPHPVPNKSGGYDKMNLTLTTPKEKPSEMDG